MDPQTSGQLDDSGYQTHNSSTVKRHLLHAFESTPNEYKQRRCRKRKSPSSEEKHLHVRKLSDIIESGSQTSPDLSSPSESFISDTSIEENCNDSSHIAYSFNEISFNRGNFQRSSPVNVTSDEFKLSTSLEKCSLYNFESHSFPKKCKWDDEELDCCRKSNSAPGTPKRQEYDSPDNLKKYRSLEFTPTKKPSSKIGTPERYDILYPQLAEVKPVQKPKSPSKLRHELKRISKPARKRLFPCKDFVHLFTNVRELTSVISKIFSFLNDSDLVSVSKVSTLWKSALENDRVAQKRYKSHLKNISISKENIYRYDSFGTPEFSRFIPTNKANLQVTKAKSPPSSPARENWRKFARMASQIKPSQRLMKCLICSEPAIIEKGIAQCSKENCRYLWCIKCFSGSKTGPSDFNCICNGSRSPVSPTTDRYGLSDISNNMEASPSYYLMENSHYNSGATVSSGYFSLSDVEKSPSVFHMQNSLDPNSASKFKNAVLTDCNKNYSTEKRRSGENNTSVLELRAARQRVKQNLARRKDIAEPGSPQKNKLHALGSKQSKRNLRRLCM